MTPALLVILAVVAVVLTIGSARRALAERDTVERNQRALDLIGALATRGVDAPPPPPYRPTHARARSDHRGRWAAALGGVSAVAVLVLGAWYLALRHHPAPAAAPPVTAATTTTSPVAPTTTAPTAGPALVLVSSDGRQADYQVEQASAAVELVPSAPCWVEITPAGGHRPAVFAGTLRSGARYPVPDAETGVSVQLGNPSAMSLVVNGAPMTLPPSGGGPFTLVFQPPAG